MNSTYLEILKPGRATEFVHVIAGHIPNTLLPSPRILRILANEVNLKDSNESTFAFFDKNNIHHICNVTDIHFPVLTFWLVKLVLIQKDFLPQGIID